jgi:PTH1 family peptidyl-tRNA hydrolase
MILLIGLGNPGPKYKNNRHNVGHMFVDYLLGNQGDNLKIKVLKTDCFMNVSGIFVNKLIRRLKLETNSLIVVHDDLDIPLGKFHIQFASGPQLHNGLESIEQHLKTKDFYRIRIGVDNRPPDRKIPGETYALQNFLHEEKKLLDTEIFPKISAQLQLDLKTVLFQKKML